MNQTMTWTGIAAETWDASGGSNLDEAVNKTHWGMAVVARKK